MINRLSMIKLFWRFTILPLLLVFAMTSCEKYTGGSGSITGPWHCSDDPNGVVRQYTVNIDRATNMGLDTTYYVILNFHNLGYDFETYVQLKNSTVTFFYNTGGYNMSGKGIVSSDRKSIDWNYSISGNGISNLAVEAVYVRK